MTLDFDEVTCSENRELLAWLQYAIRLFLETLSPWNTTHPAILLKR